MDTRFAITNYPDAAAITKKLDNLISQPIYSIKPEVLQKYEDEYYAKKRKKDLIIRRKYWAF